MTDNLDITILCKVVDNFGDIGVVYRLSRAISELKENRPDLPEIKVRIVVDNLTSFSLLEPKINPAVPFQTCNGWEIYRWDADEFCLSAFRKNPPHVIFECFQCGRPDWLEKLLFDEKVPNLVDIIMLDYLTAEDYAETFHKLQSLTRSARVQKVNFMMGFTEKTGGLILDAPFMKALADKSGGSLPLASEQSSSATPSPKGENCVPPLKNPRSFFNAVFFSYPRDWTPAVRAFQKFNESLADKESVNGTKKLYVKLAKGAGFESFKTSYKNAILIEENEQKLEKSIFRLEELPFLSQTDWDSLLVNSDLLFIRGEDSLSRACLCGKPFVWHAYPQTEEYQLVKVKALLERMRLFFSKDIFGTVEKCWLTYNETNPDALELENTLTEFLMNYENLQQGFDAFSKSLLRNGNLAEHIVDFALERRAKDGTRLGKCPRLKNFTDDFY